MKTWVILASGPSLTQQQVDYVHTSRNIGTVHGVIAVSNVGLNLAPWADALVSHDGKWWAHHKEAHKFKGLKFCRNQRNGLKHFIPDPASGCNSGYMAMQVADKVFKAELIILLGFDMQGTHYFGEHPEGLKNTTEKRFEFHRNQFKRWRGPTVINCTPNSALKVFPFAELETVL